VLGQRLGVVGFDNKLCHDVGKRRRIEEPKRTNFVFPKPYVPSFDGEHYGVRIRIFGKYLNGGGPFVPVDIMIMTQSL
jgi:hypothetical protein